MNENETELYNLKLHEELVIDDNWTAIRVPGGWVYLYREATARRVRNK